MGRDSKNGKESLANRPFKSLAQTLRHRVDEKPAPPRIAAARTPEPPDDSEIFMREMSGVEPLDARQRDRVAAPAPADPPRPSVDEDAEVLAELSELVAGRAEFDIADSDDHIEGSIVGFDPRVIRKLRQGEFAPQVHLDLHGMTAEEARVEVDRFLLESYRAGRRCILIVHGKGRNSKDQVPVLKTRLRSWLARGQGAHLVLAFTSARACDGGTGAMYILLRRERSTKRAFTVTEGAKR